MNKAERALLIAGAAAAIALALGARLPDATPFAAARAPALQPAVATVDTFEVMTRLFQSSQYLAPREAKAGELRAVLQPLQTELEELAKKYEALAQDSPERETLRATGQAKNQELQARQQELSGQMDAYIAAQIAEVYNLVAKTAQSVAAAKGIAVVFSAAPADQFKINNANETLQEILRRPVLHGAVDITPDVLKELKVETPPPPQPSTPAPPPRP